MKKHLLSLLILAASTFGAVAQETPATEPATESVVERPKRYNVIKTKPLKTARTFATGFTPISLNLSYERVIIPKLSFMITAEYGPSRSLNILDYVPMDSINFVKPSVRSFAVNPELRLYPGKKGAPRGFYIGFDFLYSKFTSTIDLDKFSFPYQMDIPGYGPYTYMYEQDFKITGGLSNMGGGIGLGTQWLAGDRVAIDILWIGLGVNYTTLSLKVDGELVDESQIEADIVSQTGYPYDIPSSEVPTWKTITSEFDEQIAAGLAEVPYFGDRVTIDAENDGVRVAMSTLSPRLRLFNFSIGVAF